MCPHLPTEILELALSYLKHDNDISSLRACALVSSTFLQISRSFLFHHVYLLPQAHHPVTTISPRSYSLAPPRPGFPRDISPSDSLCCPLGPRSESLSPTTPSTRSNTSAIHGDHPPQHEQNACLKLLHLLSTSPTLIHHIKHLTIMEGRLFPSTMISGAPMDPLLSDLDLENPYSQEYYTIRDKLNGPQWFFSTPPRALYMLFLNLKNAGLREIDVVFPDGPKISWNLIPRDIRNALQCLLQSDTLQRIELRNVQWDQTGFRELTNALSNGSASRLILRGNKIVDDLGTPTPNRGRSTTRRDLNPKKTDVYDRNHYPHADTRFQSGNPNLSTNSLNQHPSSHGQALALDSLCISATFDSTGGINQAPETSALLRALCCDHADPTTGLVTPVLVDPFKLRKLAIPGVETQHLPEVVCLLQQSGVALGIETLVLGDRLILNSTRYPKLRDPLDLSNFQNLRTLHLGINIIHDSTITLNTFITNFSSLIPRPPHHNHFGHHHHPHLNHDEPNILQWLNHTLSTIPSTLQNLFLKLTIDIRLFNSTYRDGIGMVSMGYWENDLRELGDELRTFREGGFMRNVRVGVALDMDVNKSVRSGNMERGRGRGRGVLSNYSGGATMGSPVVDVRVLKRWLEGLFVGSQLDASW